MWISPHGQLGEMGAQVVDSEGFLVEFSTEASKPSPDRAQADGLEVHRRDSEKSTILSVESAVIPAVNTMMTMME